MKNLFENLLRTLNLPKAKRAYTPKQLETIEYATKTIQKIKQERRGYDLTYSLLKELRNNNLTLKDVKPLAQFHLKRAYIHSLGKYPLYYTKENAKNSFQHYINTYPTVFWKSPEILEEQQIADRFSTDLKESISKTHTRNAQHHWDLAKTCDTPTELAFMAHYLRQLKENISYINITVDMIQETHRAYHRNRGGITYTDINISFKKWCKEFEDILPQDYKITPLPENTTLQPN